MNKTAYRRLLLIIFIVALLFRLPRLGLRPMHHDEANQAVKFGMLLEKGEYRYDKTDHHGPSLYYLTLPVARALSQTTLTKLNEVTLRLLPVLFGTGIILLLLFFSKEMSRAAILFAGLFAAISPAMVYYSRFYIQEMLFTFFILGFLGSLWRYLTAPSVRRVLMAGFFAGMMFATKETSIIIFASAGGAIVLTVILQKIWPQTPYRLTVPGLPALILGGVVGLATAAAFFSSFFKNPRGIWDSVLAFGGYFEKGGTAGLHAHPWWYYLKLLAATKSGAGPLWSEALILALALAGIVSAFFPRAQRQMVPSPARFIFFYTLLAAAVFSLIPYKTPWNLLPFFIGFIILAGIGAGALLEAVRENYLKALVLVVLAAGIFHLGKLCYLANFKFYADPVNPYVYAQTSTDYLKLVKRVNDLAALQPSGKGMLIKVVCNPEETWPLPWSLRDFGRVGYWKDARGAGGFDDAAVVISSREEAEKIAPLLRDRFQTEYYGLRPGVFLVLHIRQDLWQKFMKEKAGS